MQKYVWLLQSVSLASALIFSDLCHPKCVCMDSLVISQCDFNNQAGARICKFLAIPDWIKRRNLK